MDAVHWLDKVLQAKNLRKGGDVTEFADPKLNGEYSLQAFQLVLKLALCCSGLKQQRPSMGKVVAVLEKAYLISQTLKSIDSSFHSVWTQVNSDSSITNRVT